MLNVIQSIKIDRRSKIAVDVQLAQALRALIINFRVNDQGNLPSFGQLADLLKIEPRDVEHAYRLLEQQRLVVAVDGLTYQVRFHALHANFQALDYSVTKAIEGLGMAASITTFYARYTVLSKELACRTGWKQGSRVFAVERLYKANDRPFCLLVEYLAPGMIHMVEERFHENQPMYTQFARELMTQFHHIQRSLDAVMLDKRTLQLLDESNGAVGHLLVNKVYNQQNELIDYSEARIISNYTYVVEGAFTPI